MDASRIDMRKYFFMKIWNPPVQYYIFYG